MHKRCTIDDARGPKTRASWGPEQPELSNGATKKTPDPRQNHTWYRGRYLDVLVAVVVKEQEEMHLARDLAESGTTGH